MQLKKSGGSPSYCRVNAVPSLVHIRTLVVFGGPGLSSLSTRTRTILPWSMCTWHSTSGELSGLWVDVASELGSQITCILWDGVQCQHRSASQPGLSCSMFISKMTHNYMSRITRVTVTSYSSHARQCSSIQVSADMWTISRTMLVVWNNISSWSRPSRSICATLALGELHLPVTTKRWGRLTYLKEPSLDNSYHIVSRSTTMCNVDWQVQVISRKWGSH